MPRALDKGEGIDTNHRDILEAKEQESFKCCVAWHLSSQESHPFPGDVVSLWNQWYFLLLPSLSFQRKAPHAVLRGGGDPPLQHKDFKRMGLQQPERRNESWGIFPLLPVKRWKETSRVSFLSFLFAAEEGLGLSWGSSSAGGGCCNCFSSWTAWRQPLLHPVNEDPLFTCPEHRDIWGKARA